MPKYSIIIPFYNVEDYIIDCVKSIKFQKYSDFEALFIDDGSLDGSHERLKEYLKNNPDNRIKIFKKKNGGLSDARNYGISKSVGKYICFIDSDDFIDNDFVSKIDSKIKNEDIDILIFDFYEYYDNSKKILKKGITDKSNKKNILISPPAAWNKVYNKNLFIKNNIRYPLGLWYEDLATTPRLILNSKKILYLNEPLYYYRQRQGSIMTTLNNKNLDMIKSLDMIYDYYKKNKYLSMYKEEIEKLYIFNCYYLVRIYGQSKVKNKLKMQRYVIAYLNTKFDKWYENTYFKKINILSKMNMLFMKYDKLLFIYNFLRRIKK